MKAAVYNAILTSNVDSPTPRCPTGNCTWPITPSVAVCGDCSPVTYQTTCNPNICYYTMPSGNVVNLTNPAHETYYQVVFQVVSNKQDTYTSSSYNGNPTDRLFIAKFEAFGAPYYPNSLAALLGGTYSWSNSTTIASECALWMCVQTYNASQVDGNQTESITSEFSYFVDFNVSSPLTGSIIIPSSNHIQITLSLLWHLML